MLRLKLNHVSKSGPRSFFVYEIRVLSMASFGLRVFVACVYLLVSTPSLSARKPLNHTTNSNIRCKRLNSLAPGRFKVKFRWVIFKLILVVNGWGIFCETALIWVSLDHTYDKSTLVHVMAWCRQATSYYMSQCWPRFLPPYSATMSQWVNSFPYFSNPPLFSHGIAACT